VSTSGNGTPFTFSAFHDMLRTLRATISERKLISESFVVGTLADPTGKSGALAHTAVFSGVKDGVEVTGTTVAVLKIVWMHGAEHKHGGHRLIVAESFISAV
jgi:hypothetical protein